MNLSENSTLKVKCGGTREFKGNFTKFKKRLKRKKVFEHHQTVERPLKGTPGC